MTRPDDELRSQIPLEPSDRAENTHIIYKKNIKGPEEFILRTPRTNIDTHAERQQLLAEAEAARERELAAARARFDTYYSGAAEQLHGMIARILGNLQSSQGLQAAVWPPRIRPMSLEEVRLPTMLTRLDERPALPAVGAEITPPAADLWGLGRGIDTRIHDRLTGPGSLLEGALRTPVQKDITTPAANLLEEFDLSRSRATTTISEIIPESPKNKEEFQK